MPESIAYMLLRFFHIKLINVIFSRTEVAAKVLTFLQSYNHLGHEERKTEESAEERPRGYELKKV